MSSQSRGVSHLEEVLPLNALQDLPGPAYNKYKTMIYLNIHHHLPVYKYVFSFISSMVETVSKIRLELTIDKMSSIALKKVAERRRLMNLSRLCK